MLLLDTDLAGSTKLAMDVDDDLALLMALASRQPLAAVTVTWGNAPAQTCYTAAKQLLARAGRADVPVFLGSECSLPLPYACPSPAPSSAASSAISHLAAAHPGRITLVSLGPLSNVAAALRERPALADDLARIVIVGGSIDTGAKLARRLAANYYWLPDLGSARAVLGSRAPKVLVPVETLAGAYADGTWLNDSIGRRCYLFHGGGDSRATHAGAGATAAACNYLPALTERAELRMMRRLFPERNDVPTAGYPGMRLCSPTCCAHTSSVAGRRMPPPLDSRAWSSPRMAPPPPPPRKRWRRMQASERRMCWRFRRG